MSRRSLQRFKGEGQMLVMLNPKLVEGIHPGPTPSWLKPFFAAAKRGVPLHEAVQEIVVSFGFTSFIYGLTTAGEVRHEERFLIWTTAPAEWVLEYDAQSYIEID